MLGFFAFPIFRMALAWTMRDANPIHGLSFFFSFSSSLFLISLVCFFFLLFVPSPVNKDLGSSIHDKRALLL